MWKIHFWITGRFFSPQDCPRSTTLTTATDVPNAYWRHLFAKTWDRCVFLDIGNKTQMIGTETLLDFSEAMFDPEFAMVMFSVNHHFGLYVCSLFHASSANPKDWNRFCCDLDFSEFAVFVLMVSKSNRKSSFLNLEHIHDFQGVPPERLHVT